MAFLAGGSIALIAAGLALKIPSRRAEVTVAVAREVPSV